MTRITAGGLAPHGGSEHSFLADNACFWAAKKFELPVLLPIDNAIRRYCGTNSRSKRHRNAMNGHLPEGV